MKYVFTVLSLLIWSCTTNTNQKNIASKQEPIFQLTKAKTKTHDTSALERLFISKHLVNINSLDSNIRVVLHYSTSHNLGF